MNNGGGFGTLLSIGIDMAHYIMPYQFLPFLCHLIVDIVCMAFQFLYLFLRNDRLSVFT